MYMIGSVLSYSAWGWQRGRTTIGICSALFCHYSHDKADQDYRGSKHHHISSNTSA